MVLNESFYRYAAKMTVEFSKALIAALNEEIEEQK